MKMILSLAILWLGSNWAAAETAPIQPQRPGHWVIVHESPVKDGRAELKLPDPNAQPWNRPTPLEGQVQRWNVKWEPNSTNPPARDLKI